MMKLKYKQIISLLVSLLILLNFSSISFGKNSFFTPKLKITEGGIQFDKTTGTSVISNNKNIETDAIDSLLSEYKFFIGFGMAIAILTLVAIFIINLIKLGNSRGNPQARSSALVGLLFTGIAISALGSVTLISRLAYNFI